MTAFLAALQNPRPMIVTIVEPPPAPQATIGDVLVAALGVAGCLTILALVLGGILALVLIARHRRHPPELDRMPPVSPYITDVTGPPSSPVR